MVTIPRRVGSVTVEIRRKALEAPLAEGAPYAHYYPSGNCDASMSRPATGEFELMPHLEFVLTAGKTALATGMAGRG